MSSSGNISFKTFISISFFSFNVSIGINSKSYPVVIEINCVGCGSIILPCLKSQTTLSKANKYGFTSNSTFLTINV